MSCCPQCGQTLPDKNGLVLGLTFGERAILAIVNAAGQHGISTTDLFDRLYADDPSGGPDSWLNVVHVRIHVLNKKLKAARKEIRSTGHGRDGPWNYVLRNLS